MSHRTANAVVALSAVVAVAIVAAGAWLARRDAPPAPAPVVAEASLPPAGQKAAATGDEATAADAGAESAGLPDIPAPSFDIVRVSPDGSAVMAGRAEPGARVAILEGGREIGAVEADRRGEWVFLPEAPLAPGARELGLRATSPDGAESEAETTVAVVVPEDPDETAVAVTMGRDGGRLLQGGGDAESDVAPLAIGAVSTVAGGRVAVSGNAPPGAELHIYIDDDFLGRVRADDDGRWHLDAQLALAPGEHVVRADEVYWEGEVAARVETIFAPVAGADSRVVVARGDSLWEIAESHYGSGAQYTQIYVANADQIRQPDLIYPGQVFTLPPLDQNQARAGQ